MMTEEQINQRALKWYPKKKYTLANSYVDEEDIRQRERIAYILGCRDSKKEYKELIEAGKKWEELKEIMDNLHKDKEEGDYWTHEEVELIGEKALKIADIL